MAPKRHVKPLNNGGFEVSREIIVSISFILLLLGALLPTVAGYAVLNNDVQTLKKEYEVAGPIHTASFKALTDQVIQQDKEIELLKLKLDNIQISLNEVKTDLRDIKNKIGAN
jgi:hypothetical protein